MIECRNLFKTFGLAESQVEAVRNVNLTIPKGSYTKVVGPSGSGKSTLLNLMAGLLHPSSGEVIVDGISLYEELDANGLARFRREYLGFVFQAFNLIPYLTALENILLPLTPTGESRNAKLQMAQEALNRVGIWDRRTHRPGELSGGQQQRVAIARALVNQPEIIMADEPTGNLDSRTRGEILDLFGELNTAGHTLLMVTHDESYTGQGAVLHIQDGLVETLEPEAVNV